MAHITVERRKTLGLCVYCGQPNDRLPKLMCSKCVENDHRRNKDYYYANQEKVLSRTRKYYEDHKEEHSQWQKSWNKRNLETIKQYRLNTRRKALQIISGLEIPKCVYCGCDDVRLLEANHRNGGGSQEAKINGSNLYWAIIKGRRPIDDLEVVCRPHNAWYYLKQVYPDMVERLKITWELA